MSILTVAASPAMTNFEYSIQFFLQFAVILAVVRVVGWLGRFIGQPQVVGEMIAGVILGPSLIGHFFPEFSQYLFPRFLTDTAGNIIMTDTGKKMAHPLMTVIYCVCQVGLVLYMFIVGTEFRTDHIVKHAKSAASVSLAGILTPFALGAALALWFLHDHELFSEGVTRLEAVLFLGAAMSITAFPMLARIIYERGLSGSRLGTLALAAGSIDDAIAWCLLAVVLASFKNDWNIATFALAGGVGYAIFTLTAVRLAFVPIGMRVEAKKHLSTPLFAFVLVLLMLAAWWTDYCQIYAVFGAFILGLAMPRGVFTKQLQERIEPLTTAFLLPMFFIYSGLNTKLSLVNTPHLWLIALLVLVAACVGKFVACWLAARLHGEPNPEALAIGSLMNARGLMELIILNIGLEKGLITQTLFSIMVVMAVATTLMATPLFELVYGRKHMKDRVLHTG